MAWGLPDLKGALVGFYQEQVKPTIDSKSTEYKELLKANLARGAQTQQALIAIALGIFLLLALAFFWIDKPDSLPWKYLLLGLLTGSVSLYGLALKPEEFSQKLLPHTK